MIRLNNVFKSYNSVPALRGVSIEIPEGECAVLIGPSGCGKSTLLKTINRMVSIDSGTVEVDGVNVTAQSPESLRLRTGYCIQGVGLFPHFTVKENIALVPRLLKWPADRIEKRVMHLMELTGLPLSYLGKKPGELSGGEAQRVGVCRALAADPPILLMDEPFGSVDPLNRERLQDIFVSLQKELKKTVLFVTHDVEEAIMIGDRIFVMNNGMIEASGSPGHFAGKTDNSFAVSFLGSEYPLKLLKRYTIKDLDLSVISLDHSAVSAVSAVSTVSDIPVIHGESMDLKQLLSEMMRLGSRRLRVIVSEDEIIEISYSDLVRHLQEVCRK